MVAGLTAALLLALSAPAASAASAVAGAAGAPNAKRGAPPDSARHFPSPLSVMLRSAIVPGWGQVVNHKLIKAVLVVGGEGLLISKALDEYHKEQDAADLASRAADPDAYQAALVSKDRHYNLKINYVWWGLAAHLLQMADAYVDAHLASFDADFGPEDAPHQSAVGPEPDRKGGPRLAVAVHVRF